LQELYQPLGKITNDYWGTTERDLAVRKIENKRTKEEKPRFKNWKKRFSVFHPETSASSSLHQWVV